MIARAVEIIAKEWKVSILFVFIILVLGALLSFTSESRVPIIPVLNAVLSFISESRIFISVMFLSIFWIYNGFFLFVGRSLKGEKIHNPYTIVFGGDKKRYDFFILLAFFAAILTIIKGPALLFNMLFSEKYDELLASMGNWRVLFYTIGPLIDSIYRISLFSAVASITYHRNEVLESFLTGLKGIWRFKSILVVLFSYYIARSFLIASPHSAIRISIVLFSSILPAIIILLMSCDYSLDGSYEIPDAESSTNTVTNIPGGI